MESAGIISVLKDLELCSQLLEQNKAISYGEIEERVELFLGFFLDVKDCLNLFSCTSSSFVHFQICKLLKNLILQHFDKCDIKEFQSSLANFLKLMPEVPYYVENSLINIFCLVYKICLASPSISEDSFDLSAIVNEFTSSNELFLRKRGYLIMKAAIYEMVNDSTNFLIGITCEKQESMNVFFQNILKMFVTTCSSSLAYYIQLDNSQWLSILPAILSAMFDIFSWNFVDVNSVLHPSWHEIIYQLNLPETFVKLFSKVRVIDSDLAVEILQCVAQLSLAKGDLLLEKAKKIEFISNITIFILSGLSMADSNEKEIFGISSIIHSLITSNSSDVFLINKQLLLKFLSVFNEVTCYLCCFSNEQGRFMGEALGNLLQSWYTLLDSITLQGQEVINEFRSHSGNIFSSFLKGHISFPEGNRNQFQVVKESQLEYQNEIEDAKDENLYSDHLFIIGMLGRLSVKENLGLVLKCLYSKMESLKRSFITESEVTLTNIYEDIHWLLLALSELMTDQEGIQSTIPVEVIQFSQMLHIVNQEDLLADKSNEFVSIVLWIHNFLSMEVEAQRLGLMGRFSPLLESSFLGFVTRFCSAYVVFDENNYSELSICLATLFGSDSKIGTDIVKQMLEKVCFNLKVWNSEEEIMEKTLNLFHVISSNKDRNRICLASPMFWGIVKGSISEFLPLSRNNKLKLLLEVFSALPLMDKDTPFSLEKISCLLVGRLKEITCSIPKSNTSEKLGEIQMHVSVCFDWLVGLLSSTGIASFHKTYECFSNCWTDICFLAEILHTHDEVFEEIFNIYFKASQTLVPFLEGNEIAKLLQSFVLFTTTYEKHTSRISKIENFEVVHVAEKILINILDSDAEYDPGFNNLLASVLKNIVPLLDNRMLDIPEGSVLFSSLMTAIATRNVEVFLILDEKHFMQVMTLIENILLGTYNIDANKNSLEFVQLFAEGLTRNSSHCSPYINSKVQRLLEIVFQTALLGNTAAELDIPIYASLCGLVVLLPQTYNNLALEVISKSRNGDHLAQKFTTLMEILQSMSSIGNVKNRFQHFQSVKSHLFEIRRLIK